HDLAVGLSDPGGDRFRRGSFRRSCDPLIVGAPTCLLDRFAEGDGCVGEHCDAERFECGPVLWADTARRDTMPVGYRGHGDCSTAGSAWLLASARTSPLIR